MFLFCHIPKTAGTSLRVSLEQDTSRVLLNDYGVDNQQTSLAILKHQYALPSAFGKDVEAVRNIEALNALQPFGIYGHVPVQRYLSLVELDKVVSFVREPISRIISEYRHVVRINKYKHDLLTFANQKRLINSMSKFLNGAPWPMFGFIGLSEQYTDSLKLINRKYDLHLSERSENMAPSKSVAQISEQALEMLNQLNQKDIKLYNDIAQQFAWRVRLNDSDPCSSFVHGGYSYNSKSDALNGFAYVASDDLKVGIEVRHTSGQSTYMSADRSFGLGRRFNIKQDGKIGFAMPLKGRSPNEFSLFVKSTQQPLPFLSL